MANIFCMFFYYTDTLKESKNRLGNMVDTIFVYWYFRLPGSRETVEARQLNVSAAFWAGVSPAVALTEPTARRKEKK